MVMKVDVQDEHGRSIGQLDCSYFLRLPTIINWQGRTFQRYGHVNDYRYIEEPITIIDAAAITLF